MVPVELDDLNQAVVACESCAPTEGHAPVRLWIGSELGQLARRVHLPQLVQVSRLLGESPQMEARAVRSLRVPELPLFDLCHGKELTRGDVHDAVSFGRTV